MPYAYGTDEWEENFSKLMRDMLSAEPEPYIMGTPSWICAFEGLIQNDPTYKEVAREWEGKVIDHIVANPALGLDEDMYVLMDLWHGECRAVSLVPREVGENGDYILSASYERWKQVMTGELDPVKGMMQGKIKLKGDLPTIVRYVKASTRLAELVGQVNTIFLDDLTPEEIESFRPWIGFIREEYGL